MVKALLRVSGGTILRIRVPDTRVSSGYDGTSGSGGYHPHDTYVLIPNGTPQFSFTCLPGGGGFAGQQARYLNVLYNGVEFTPDNVNWPLLQKYGGIVGIFCSGQSLTGPGQVYNVNADGSPRLTYAPGANPFNPNDYAVPAAFCWSNGFETSGVDDDQYLLDLLVWQKANLSTVLAQHLGGHSSGGMQTSKMWMLHPEAYSHHVTWAGPLSTNEFSDGGYPVTMRPKLDFVGDQDDIVGALDYLDPTISHVYDNIWNQNPKNFNKSDVSWPDLSGWWSNWEHYKLKCAYLGLPEPQITDGVLNGNLLTYKTPDNKQQCVIISGATHQFSSITRQSGHGSMWNLAGAWFVSTAGA